MNFYSYGQPFTGSFKGMRYRIIMEKRETGKDKDDKPVFEKYFMTEVWPEPYSYEATEPEKISKKEFPFTAEGYDDLIKYLNERHADFQPEQNP